MSQPFSDLVRARTLDSLNSPRLRDRVARTRPVAAARARFVAGEHVDDAVAEAQRLRRTHRMAALHPLLEPVTDLAGIDRTVVEAVTAIERVAPVTAGGDYHPEIYLGPEDLGVGLDADRAAAALDEVCTIGDAHRVDITLRSGAVEDVDTVLDLVESTRTAHPRLTTSLVARRHRSEADALRLASSGARVRLVRGGAGSRASDSWQDPHETDLAYARCLAILLGSDVHTVVATHEPLLLDLADGLADQSGRGPEGLEYQFFLGAQPDLQMRTADAGHRVRVLVPYGPAWVDYLDDLARRPSDLRRLTAVLTGQG
ncbi:MAG: proline dehydrogenase family protein [Janibacter sp.]